MPNIRLSLKEFPQLRKLIKGQKLTLKIKGKVKVISGADIDCIEVETSGFDYDEEKMSTHQIMQSIAESLNQQNVTTV